MKSLKFLVFGALIFFCTQAIAQSAIVSDFASNADGWVAPDALGGTVTYSATGGNPNGYISGRTPGSIPLGAGVLWIPFYFRSPGKFGGNRSAYYGGGITYDASQTTTGTATQYATAILTSNAGISIYYFPPTPFQPPSFGTWTNFTIPLSVTDGGWKTTNSATGPAVAATQLQSILTTLDNIQIIGLYRNANVATRLDNIIMRPPINITTQPVSATRCENLTATFNVVATNNPNITYRWQSYNPFSGGADLNNSTVYSNVTTNTLSINTTGGLGAGQYRVRISGLGVSTIYSNVVTLTINPAPSPPTTNGASSCGPGNLKLDAFGATPGQYRWYNVATGGTSLNTGNSFGTPFLTTTTNYWVAINNGTCESTRTIVTATILTPPTAPTTSSAARCGNGALTLSAAGGAAGQYRWYVDNTTPTPISGQTAATFNTGVLTANEDYYVSIDNGTCESTRTLVTATINTIPAAPGVAGAARCGPGTVNLTATGGTAGQYRWYTVPTGGAAISGQTNAIYSPSITATTNYYVAINNTFCEGARTLVVATMNTIPAAPTTTNNSRCGNGAITLTAAGGATGQYRWYTVATGGTAIGGQTNATYSPTLTATTNYWVSIDNGTCESTRTMVTGTINTIPGAPTTTGNSRCGTGAITLTAAGGTAGQYRWYTVSTGGTAISGQTNATYTPSITATTNFYVAINNTFCEGARTLVVATMNTIPTAPTTTGNSRCGSGTVTLTAAGGAAGQYRWYTVPTGGIAIGGQTNATYSPSITTTTNYYVAINNTFCESARTLVVATMNTIPVLPTVVGNNGCIPSSVTLSASGGTNGQYRWYTDPTAGPAIPGQVNSTFTTPVLSVNTTYYVSINNGFCEGPRASVTATLNNPPAPPTTTGGSGCIPGVVTLSASGGVDGEFRWYADETGGTAIAGEVNSTFETPELSANTTYYVSINNGCESARIAVVATLIQPPAAPSVTVDDNGFACVPRSFDMTASGGNSGNYRWYEDETSTSSISTSGVLTTPVISVTRNYYVALFENTCESARVPVTLTIGGPQCTTNSAPVIKASEESTSIGGEVSFDLEDLISDPDNNLELSSLTIVTQPKSGAEAIFDETNNRLVINYGDVPFSGRDEITIRVCDNFSSCTEQTLVIQVVGDIVVYNAVSPNKDGKNEIFLLEHIEKIEGTRKNRVTIYNRWGDLVWEGRDYNNTTIVFTGTSKNNTELPSGTYYYKIEFDGRKAETGYLELKR